jgi:uncharacterized repeat protein (TIGR03803 family)
VCGTVYKITTSGRETVIHNFGSGSDGAQPDGSLIDVKGTLYGVTGTGGADGNGTVFTIAPSGAETVLYSFRGYPDGASPAGGLIYVNGAFYGTTGYGGTIGLGTIFQVTVSGKEHVLHSFAGGSDGENPTAGLTNVNGRLYGTTPFGGSGGSNENSGIVFEITKSGMYSVVYSFKDGSDGAQPTAGLIDVSGTLYGTTGYGGAHNLGTVFSLSL